MSGLNLILLAPFATVGLVLFILLCIAAWRLVGPWSTFERGLLVDHSFWFFPPGLSTVGYESDINISIFVFICFQNSIILGIFMKTIKLRLAVT